MDFQEKSTTAIKRNQYQTKSELDKAIAASKSWLRNEHIGRLKLQDDSLTTHVSEMQLPT